MCEDEGDLPTPALSLPADQRVETTQGHLDSLHKEIVRLRKQEAHLESLLEELRNVLIDVGPRFGRIIFAAHDLLTVAPHGPEAEELRVALAPEDGNHDGSHPNIRS